MTGLRWLHPCSSLSRAHPTFSNPEERHAEAQPEEDRAVPQSLNTELVLVASRHGRLARVTALLDPVESAVHDQLIL